MPEDKPYEYFPVNKSTENTNVIGFPLIDSSFNAFIIIYSDVLNIHGI